MPSNKTVVNRVLFVCALRHMGEEDLRHLNRMMMVERLKLPAQAKSTVQLTQSAPGDHSSFTTASGQ